MSDDRPLRIKYMAASLLTVHASITASVASSFKSSSPLISFQSLLFCKAPFILMTQMSKFWPSNLSFSLKPSPLKLDEDAKSPIREVSHNRCSKEKLIEDAFRASGTCC